MNSTGHFSDHKKKGQFKRVEPPWLYAAVRTLLVHANVINLVDGFLDRWIDLATERASHCQV